MRLSRQPSRSRWPCSLASDEAALDTDGDAAAAGAKDGCEIASLNGDRVVNSIDQGSLAQHLGAVNYLLAFDIKTDGATNSIDQGMMGTLIVPPGQCP